MSDDRESRAGTSPPRATYEAGLDQARTEEAAWKRRSGLASTARLLCFLVLAELPERRGDSSRDCTTAIIGVGVMNPGVCSRVI